MTLRSGWVVCLLALTGCTDTETGPDHLDEYLHRLATVTGVELVADLVGVDLCAALKNVVAIACASRFEVHRNGRGYLCAVVTNTFTHK